MAAAPAAEAEGGAGHGGEGAAEAGPGSPMGSPMGSPRGSPQRRDAAAEPPWPWGEEWAPSPRLPLARCPGTSHRATSPTPPGRGGLNPPPRAVGSPPGPPPEPRCPRRWLPRRPGLPRSPHDGAGQEGDECRGRARPRPPRGRPVVCEHRR